MVAIDRIIKGIKYDISKLCNFAHVKLTTSEIEFFKENLDYEKMTDEVVEFWISQD